MITNSYNQTLSFSSIYKHLPNTELKLFHALQFSDIASMLLFTSDK